MAGLSIQPIDEESVHRIWSGQVVLDLSSAMKELIENSLDAQATAIEIIFKENGLEGIEVIDNGTGVDPSNYENLALKHHTSKLTEFQDLERMDTFGFRGEALGSLCALGNLVVVTATKEQAPKGVRLEYDHRGHLISTTSVARSVGTTIQLHNLFHSLPVRQREFKRNIKREYGKALAVIQTYAIISAGIRMVASNQPSKGSKMRVMSTNGNLTLRENLTNVFGAKTVTQIVSFEIDLVASTSSEDHSRKLDHEFGLVTGFISKPQFGHGRQKSDRQYFYINGRPCHLPRMTKAFNELYRNFISNQYPFVVANFKIPTDSYDVNVTPDKRTIFLHQEHQLAEIIMYELGKQLEPSRSTFGVNPLLSQNDNSSSTAAGRRYDDNDNDDDYDDDGNNNLISEKTSTTLNVALLESFAHKSGKAYRPTVSSSSTTSTRKSIGATSGKRSGTSTLLNYVKRAKGTHSLWKSTNDSDTRDEMAATDESQDDAGLPDATKDDNGMDDDDNNNDIDDIEEIEDFSKDATNDSDFNSDIRSSTTAMRGLWHSMNECVTIGLQLEQLHEISRRATSETATTEQDNRNMAKLTSSLKQASLRSDDNEVATAALDRVINKTDFARIKVLGQFNLGFIIGLLDDHDLFIIDQHAADEKYNFETLQQSTQINGQQLIRPQPIDLTASEELLVMDNMNIFRANGFNIQIDENGEPTKRISVLSQPFSKNTMLDKKDISELVYLISERPGEMVRCSRIRSMFASRACRKSVMIGDSLNKQQMIKIIRHMGEINQPWNCPHGRPTMRHLMTISAIKEKVPQRRRHPTCQGSLFS
ncbi:mismatch repair endonuclease PMS2 [Halteromyces radiatus]|uniref:mismatch repair endonuclease PMS2 n=1 Tax=Halteromyces radiatus TaxID=101107 RepID=UPI00221E632F|nr:mismatch repair endonuclease PMS2 [Halteromyces radiatus]KAI8086554.1 mismatch repair endonuclease PMS2 [Halteromyces radiatus]